MTAQDEDTLRAAVAAQPGEAGPWLALIDFTAARDGGSALALIARANGFVPGHPELQLRQALLLLNSGQLGQAEPLLDALVRLPAPPPAALLNLAILFFQTGRAQEAEALALRGAALFPGDAAIRSLAGKLMSAAGDLAQAEAHLMAAVALKPGDAAIQHDAGTILWKSGQLEQSISYFQAAVAADRAAVHSWIALSNALMHLDRRTEAVEAARTAVSLAPGLAEARKQLAYALFAAGNLLEAWDAYRARLEVADDGRRQRHAGLPEWGGEAIDPARLVFWMEQGIGDQIFFASMLPDLAQEFPGAAVETDPRLIPALARAFPALTFVPQTTPPQPAVCPPLRQAQFPMADLGGRYRRRYADFPARPGFLTADPHRAALIAKLLPPRSDRMRIGVVWTSSMLNPYRRHWFAEARELAAVFNGFEADLINLQYGWTDADLAAAEAAGLSILTVPDVDLFADVEGVFALMSCLDCAVGPGNTATQMAAAIGLPVFRFYFGPGELDTLGTDHVPWLPSIRQFRRHWGEDWGRALGQLRQALISYAAQTGKRHP